MFNKRYLISSIALACLWSSALITQGDVTSVDESALSGEMVLIPGGTFLMGNMSEGIVIMDENLPVHSVTISSFSMGKYEVTVGQFRRFVEATGYLTDAELNMHGFNGCNIHTSSDTWNYVPHTSWRNPGFDIGDEHPVVCVSWSDAQTFVNWLAAQTGESYRLPTEAEWEYATRAGSTSKYYFGNNASQLCHYANHADSSTSFDFHNESCSDGVGKRTAVVGRYRPNRYGLYDMHGNTWEWVEDCWHSSYMGAPSDGSAWTYDDCTNRVVRSGAWFNWERYVRSATRKGGESVASRNSGLGFRLAKDN